MFCLHENEGRNINSNFSFYFKILENNNFGLKCHGPQNNVSKWSRVVMNLMIFAYHFIMEARHNPQMKIRVYDKR